MREQERHRGKGAKPKEVLVDRREAGLRLDLFLVGAYQGLSRKQAKRLIDGHRVSVNGRIEALASREMALGEKVAVSFPDVGRAGGPPELAILYEDPDCLAVLKPSGIPSGPTRDASRPHAARIAEERSGRSLTLLHRLDKDTSGVLLLAKTAEAASALTRAFRERKVEKVYLAIVQGKPPKVFEAVSYLKEGEAGRMLLVRSGGMRADTAFRTLVSKGGFSLVEARPRTGRTHQIRVQLAERGHPIVGDHLYGGAAAVRIGAEERPATRQMLHAWRLGFQHPTLPREITVEAPLPEDFRNLAAAIFGRLRLPA